MKCEDITIHHLMFGYLMVFDGIFDGILLILFFCYLIEDQVTSVHDILPAPD